MRHLPDGGATPPERLADAMKSRAIVTPDVGRKVIRRESSSIVNRVVSLIVQSIHRQTPVRIKNLWGWGNYSIIFPK